MLPAIDAIMGVPNYGATTAKAALQLLGVLDNRNVRSPLVPLDDDEVVRAARRPRGVGRPLTDLPGVLLSHPHPELSAPAAAAGGTACGSSRSAVSARSAAT